MIIPKPYRWYWHPHMGLLDLLVGIAVYYLFPWKVVIENDQDSEKAVEESQNLRHKVVTTGVPEVKKALKNWGKYMGCDILQYNLEVPQRASILLEWGFIKTPNESLCPCERSISVRMHMPESVLKNIKYERQSDPDPLICCPQITVELSKLKDIPVVLCLHGGGFHMGDSMDPALMDLLTDVAKFTSQPFVCAFFTYRQIPEHCFPAAIEDVLTVSMDLLGRFSSLHLVGVSAGANLATVATMELHRRYPGRIRSATLLCPMLNPAANSMSYYMNRNVCFVSPEWLRWCWRTYLGLPSASESENVPDLDHDSNRTAWEASKWYKSPLARFIDPTRDLPDGLDDRSTTQFIVTTNAADPLRDDGKHLVAQLQAREAQVKHLQHLGSHWLGTALDAKQKAELVQEMARVLFPLHS